MTMEMQDPRSNDDGSACEPLAGRGRERCRVSGRLALALVTLAVAAGCTGGDGGADEIVLAPVESDGRDDESAEDDGETTTTEPGTDATSGPAVDEGIADLLIDVDGLTFAPADPPGVAALVELELDP